MKPINDLFKQIADEYSLIILNWAVKKTGSRSDGEDLAQEVMCQVLTFLQDRRSEKIEKLENLIWKIAYYTWCNRLRGLKRAGGAISLNTPAGLYMVEEHDYINEFTESEALKFELAKMRRRISELSKVQRELIFAYYLEGLSVSDVAVKFNIKQSAVKWHLFDARKKIKEKMGRCDMNNNLNIIKPGKLFLGTSGSTGPDPDTKRVNDNLIRQNICLLCYGENGKTIDELTEVTGIPKPYLEFDLDWLVDREFVLFEGKRYITNFGIKSKQHFQDVKEIYIKARKNYYQKIINYFNANESKIRAIGFHGCDFDWNILLWSMLTLYLRYFSESEPLKTLKEHNNSGNSKDYNLHKDGGRYVINGFNQSENQGVDLSKGGVLTEPIFEPDKWNKVSGIWCGSISETTSEFRNDIKLEYATYWLGIYIFADNISTLTKNADQQKLWKNILAHILNNDFSIADMTAEEKELIATGVKENIIKKGGNKYIPQFTVFTFEQYRKLYTKIFEPIVQMVKPQTLELVATFQRLNERGLPKKINGYAERWTYFDIWDSGIKNFMFAAEDGYLYMPETPEDGVKLTLSFVY